MRYSYLELADWELHDALQSAKEDREWETEEVIDDFKGGQIGVKLNFSGGKPFLKLRGIGRGSIKKKDVTPAPNKPEESKVPLESTTKPKKTKQKAVIHSKLPSIATKSVYAEDLYKVSFVDFILFTSFWIFSHVLTPFKTQGRPGALHFRARVETNFQKTGPRKRELIEPYIRLSVVDLYIHVS
jgi:hypothetical protein